MNLTQQQEINYLKQALEQLEIILPHMRKERENDYPKDKCRVYLLEVISNKESRLKNKETSSEELIKLTELQELMTTIKADKAVSKIVYNRNKEIRSKRAQHSCCDHIRWVIDSMIGRLNIEERIIPKKTFQK